MKLMKILFLLFPLVATSVGKSRCRTIVAALAQTIVYSLLTDTNPHN